MGFQPNPNSNIEPNHLKYFYFIGRIVGKALQTQNMLEAYFTRSFYKHILGLPLTYHDMEDIDPTLYKSMKFMTENDCTGIGMNMCYEKDHFGRKEIVDIIPNGRNIEICEENKEEYVKEMCYVRMGKGIKG